MATSKTVIIGCKLPNGLVIEHPLDPTQKVELAGLNKALIIGAEYATTEVDGELWETFEALHKEFGPLKSGAIFVAKTRDDAKAKAKELSKEKTGFEKMPQEVGDLKPADKE
jgi:hypothetical protein